MSEDHRGPNYRDGQDAMENGFDELRLAASQLRMSTEQGRQIPQANTGNPHTDALLQQVVSGLIDATEGLANETDRVVDHFHPLYLADKNADGSRRPEHRFALQRVAGWSLALAGVESRAGLHSRSVAGPVGTGVLRTPREP